MGQCHIAFGHADEMACLVSGHGDHQGLAVGHADVFAGKPDQAAGYIQRVFPRLQHTGQPVDGGVYIAVAHGFVQGRDQVVMFFAVFVVQQ